MRRLALFAAALLVGACTTDDTAVSSGPRAERGSSEVTEETVAAFSSGLVRSPAWGTARRFSPPEVRSLIQPSGQITGRLVGVSLATPEPVPASELFGQDVELQPGMEDGKPLEGPGVVPMLSLQSVLLEISTESSSPDLNSNADSVVVPIVVWTSADAGETQQRLLEELTERLRALAPIGAKTLVLATDVDSVGDRNVARTPGHEVFAALAAVVFETSGSGLVSLDPLIGDSAEEYFGVASLAELQALLST